jgi:tripartite-type tricarboxylate transporter receptor subunit TctC
MKTITPQSADTRLLSSSEAPVAASSPTRRRLIQASAGLIAGAPAFIHAQPKQLRVIVPLPAGGAADVGVRLITDIWAQLAGMPIVVENRPGASYLIGMQAMQNAPADGSVLIHLNNGMSATQLTFGKYDLLKQLAMVGKFGGTPGTIFVKADSPMKTPADLIANLKANPGKLNYGTILGGQEHMTTVLMLRNNGCSAQAIPFKGGPDSVTALAQGETDFAVSALPLVVPFKGRIRPLCVMTDKRFSLMPDIPSFRDTLGTTAPALDYWGGFGVPAATPAPVVEGLYKTLTEVMKNPDLPKKFAAQGLVIDVDTPAALRKLIADDLTWMAPIAAELNLKAG